MGCREYGSFGFRNFSIGPIGAQVQNHSGFAAEQPLTLVSTVPIATGRLLDRSGGRARPCRCQCGLAKAGGDPDHRRLALSGRVRAVKCDTGAIPWRFWSNDRVEFPACSE